MNEHEQGPRSFNYVRERSFVYVCERFVRLCSWTVRSFMFVHVRSITYISIFYIYIYIYIYMIIKESMKHKYITLTLVTHIPKSNYLSAAISYSNISHSLLSLNHLSNFKNISTNQFQRTSFCLLHSDAAPPPPPLFSRNRLTTSASPHHRRSVLFAPWSLLFWPDFFGSPTGMTVWADILAGFLLFFTFANSFI